MAKNKRTLGAQTSTDFAQLKTLRKMQRIALILLVIMAVIFGVSYIFESKIHWLTFVRAAAEGGLVGGLADWFAVTALFRRPLGLPIPHTNLIATKKDELGEGLGGFIENNFLSDDVIEHKLTDSNIALKLGSWLSNPESAATVSEHASNAVSQALKFVGDGDVQNLLDGLIREHIVEKDWAPVLGRAGQQMVDAGHHNTLIDLFAEQFEIWLINNPQALESIISNHIPGWMPSFVNKMVDTKFHGEFVKFAQDIQGNPAHPLRVQATKLVREFTEKLEHDPELSVKVNTFGQDLYQSARVRGLAGEVWQRAKETLLAQLGDAGSPVRQALSGALRDFGDNLVNNAELQQKINAQLLSISLQFAKKYRHKIAGIVSETVAKWEADEAAQKIELQVGKDLQYIRINGTVVGTLAGGLITCVAWALSTITH